MHRIMPPMLVLALLSVRFCGFQGFALFWFFVQVFGFLAILGDILRWVLEKVCESFCFLWIVSFFFALCVLFDEFQQNFWSVLCDAFGSLRKKNEEIKGVTKNSDYIYIFLFFSPEAKNCISARQTDR
jgi:hypothetical protein